MLLYCDSASCLVGAFSGLCEEYKNAPYQVLTRMTGPCQESGPAPCPPARAGVPAPALTSPCCSSYQVILVLRMFDYTK